MVLRKRHKCCFLIFVHCDPDANDYRPPDPLTHYHRQDLLAYICAPGTRGGLSLEINYHAADGNASGLRAMRLLVALLIVFIEDFNKSGGYDGRRQGYDSYTDKGRDHLDKLSYSCNGIEVSIADSGK